MTFWWHHFERPTGGYVPYQTPLSHFSAADASTGSAATSAAREAMHTGQTGFAHGPHPPPSGIPPHIPHNNGTHPYAPYPQINYSSMHRYGRRGPRLFPLLLVGGAGVWSYHHLKHRIFELQDELRSLKNIVFAQAQRQGGEEATEPVSAPVPEQRRRKWERRWGDKGQNVASISVVEDKLV